MRTITTTLVALHLALNLFAQAPQKMSYQTVLRNSSDMLIANTLVGMRISLRQGSPTGTAVYVETHTPTTNTNGLASVEIGSGAIVSGTIAAIDWANGPYFIETETDPNGGAAYSITGTSQLLSVPYAFNASGVTLASPNGTLWNLSVDNNGVFNADQVCTPPPTNAYAGIDQLNIPGASTTLSANTPTEGTGTWSIVSGTAGAVANPSNVASGFTGATGEVYVLRWAITNSCGTSYDDVTISFTTSGFTLPNCNCYGQTLFVFPSDNSTGIIWHNTGSLIGVSGQSPNDGEQNTNAIIGVNGTATTYAAQMCYEINAYGYSDWYLPSKDELNCLYQNAATLGDNFYDSNDQSPYPLTWYWSSTEYSEDQAWFQNFASGYQGTINKWYVYQSNYPRLRCVRKNP